jgi:hypothetical protein
MIATSATYTTKLEKETLTQVRVWAASFFFEEKVDQPKWQTREKEKDAGYKRKRCRLYFCTGCNIKACPWFNVLGVCAGYQHW